MLHGQAHIKAQQQITSKKKKMHKEQTFNIWVLLLSIHKENNMNQTEKHYIIIIPETESVYKAKEIFLSLTK